MRVLALDSTTRAGSAAIVEDDRVLLERSGDAARPHAERLPGELLIALADASVPLDSIDLFAIASGPGSFTGLRIGIATIQGLAFARRARVVAVSALEALAQIAAGGLAPGDIVGAWMDAYRREVFSALYRVHDGPPFSDVRLEELEPPAVGAAHSVFERWTANGRSPSAIIGDGAVLYAGAIQGQSGIVAPPPLAGAVGLIAVHRARSGRTIDPAGVQPLYVRRPDAEVARERAAGQGTQAPEGAPRSR